MGRHTGPKIKLSGREVKDLFGTGGEALEWRLGQPAGEHGRGRLEPDIEEGLILAFYSR